MSATGFLPMFSSWAVNVGAYLGDEDLSTSEQARLFAPPVLAYLWEEAACRLLSGVPLWGTKAQDAVQRLCDKGAGGKSMIPELRLLRRTLLMPKDWEPWICPTSFSSVRALPRGPAPGPHDMPRAVPEQAAIALATGAFRGQPLVVGMRMASAGPVGDAACMGVEAVSARKAGISMSVSFAPFSGRCFIQHACNGPTMRTQALPELHAAPSLSAWVQVTEAGGIRFLRQADGSEPEEVGFMPPEMFPGWIGENYACVHFWGPDLKAEVHVSVEHSGANFPASLKVPRDCPSELGTVWELLDAEEWA